MISNLSCDADFTDFDQQFMSRAMELAWRGQYTVDPNPKVGCVLVRDNRIIGEGWHKAAGGAHAEINALENCTESPLGATAYVTLEPCSHHGRTGPCADALITAQIAAVVVATEDPHPLVHGRGIARLRAANIDTRVGLMAASAAELNRGFFKRVTDGRPYVRVKVAASLDGATALANGQSKWITCDAARRDVHRLRARSSAIVTGVGTVLADNPRMTARVDETESNTTVLQPLPVVLDSYYQTPADARITQHPALIFVHSKTHTPDHASIEFHAVGGELISRRMCLDLNAVLNELGKRQINDVLVEAGPRLSGAFIASGLVDELIMYQSPRLMGSAARGMLDLGTFESMDEIINLTLIDSRRVGQCQRMTYTVDR